MCLISDSVDFDHVIPKTLVNQNLNKRKQRALYECRIRYDKTRNIHLKVKSKTLSRVDGSSNVNLVLFQCRLNAT